MANQRSTLVRVVTNKHAKTKRWVPSEAFTLQPLDTRVSNRRLPQLHRVWHYVAGELQRNNAYLVPVRFFIGLGWLRAGVEKVIEPGWITGEALTTFLHGQLHADAIYFPFYQTLVTQVFEPNVVLLSWLVMLGQLLTGVAILCGALTNLALLCAMFMNLNFVLVGVVNPSAFYLVIQGVLFASNIGATLGCDGVLSRFVSSIFLVAQQYHDQSPRRAERWILLSVTAGSWLSAGWVVPFIRDTSPHSVHDPAMLLFILGLLGGLLTLIMSVRAQAIQPVEAQVNGATTSQAVSESQPDFSGRR